MFVDMRGMKVFSFGWWGTRGWLEIVDEMLRRMGTGGETEVRLEVTGLQNFCLASPLSLAPWEKKKSIISKNTLFFNWPFREKKRGRGGVNLVRGLGCN